MKNQKGYAKGIRIILYILDIFFICLLGYKIYNSSLKHSNNQNNIQETEKITFDETIIKDLISSIPFDITTMGAYKDAYNGEKTTVDNILSMALASTTIGRYKESYTAKNGNDEEINSLLKAQNIDKAIVYYKDDINNQLVKKYNIDLNMIESSPKDIELVYLNDKYITIILKPNDIFKHSKISIEYNFFQEKDEIIVREKTLFMVTENNKYQIYTNTNIDSEKPIKVYEVTETNNTFETISNQIKEDMQDYQSEFKHIFKKGANGYYWYSTEFIQ